MIVKMLMIGASGVGKTHNCVKIAKAVGGHLIDVDNKATEIIQKLEADEVVRRLDGTPFNIFLKSLKESLNDNTPLIIIDSLTELKDIIKRHVKNKIISKGEFWMGGVERQETTKIDPDLFVITWELHPIIYDKIRDIMKAINSSKKSYIVTYHPPIQQASKGDIQMLNELKRINNMTVTVNEDTVVIKNDVFLNRKGEMPIDEFIDYVQQLLKANHIKEVNI